MVRFFKSSFPVQFITIGVTGLLLWGIGAIHPPVMPPPNGPVPLYSILFGWLSGIPYLAMCIGFLLVLFQAFWLNHIILRHNLASHNTSLPALLFLLFISLLPSWLTLTPVNISTFFLLFILRALLEAYNQEEPIELVYTAGFFVALSSFFYLPSLLFYGFILIAFLVYRSMKWREWISSLIGLITPFLYLVVLYFLTDRLPGLLSLYSGYFGQVDIVFPDVEWNTLILVAFLGIFMLLGLLDTISHIAEKTVELRKKNIILLWMLVSSIGTILFANSLLTYFPALLSVCISIFATNFFMRRRKLFWLELLLWLFVILLFINTAIWPYLPVN
ncbi:MAG: hypothetical protein IH596_09545 [Bacteroidales bacterium]|nr:hypothetical protein [Bacteroidales bacterium]